MRKHYFNRDRPTINHQPFNRKFVKRKSTTSLMMSWSANRLINLQATVMSGSIEIPLRDTDEVSKVFSLWMHKPRCWSTTRDMRVRNPRLVLPRYSSVSVISANNCQACHIIHCNIHCNLYIFLVYILKVYQL